MRPSQIFRMNASYAWRKFGLCFFMLALAGGLFWPMVILTMPVSKVLGWGMFILWLILCTAVGYLFYQKVLCLLHAANIASATRSLTTGKGPYPSVYFAKRVARKRFRSVKSYRGIRKLMYRSILQLQAYFEHITDDVGEVPGMQTLLAIGKYIEHRMLTYLADGCIGYLFWCNDLGSFTAAKESVAVYAYNWNRLTDKSGETAVVVIGSSVVCAAGAAVGLSAAFDAMNLGAYSYLGAILGIVLVLILKYAFLDSYLSIRALWNLLGHAQDTVLSDSLYSKLSGVSKAYHSLCAASRTQEARLLRAVKQQAEQRQTVKSAKKAMPRTRICPNCQTVNDVRNEVCSGCHLVLR